MVSMAERSVCAGKSAGSWLIRNWHRVDTDFQANDIRKSYQWCILSLDSRVQSSMMAGKRARSVPERGRERFLDCPMQAIRLAMALAAALFLLLKRRLLFPNSGHYTVVGNSIRAFNGVWLAQMYRYREFECTKIGISLDGSALGGGISGACAVLYLIRERRQRGGGVWSTRLSARS